MYNIREKCMGYGIRSASSIAVEVLKLFNMFYGLLNSKNKYCKFGDLTITKNHKHLIRLKHLQN